MTRKPLAAAMLSILFGCSPVGPYLPDGGRPNLGCFDGNGVLPIKVLGADGKPVPGATVTATHRSSGKTVSGTTDGNGVTYVLTEAIGSGDVDLTAVEGTRVSAAFSAQWTCGECDCIATPAFATLRFQ